jgi:hypothetical protein
MMNERILPDNVTASDLVSALYAAFGIPEPAEADLERYRAMSQPELYAGLADEAQQNGCKRLLAEQSAEGLINEIKMDWLSWHRGETEPAPKQDGDRQPQS